METAADILVPDGLYYVTGCEPGYTRIRQGRGFKYLDSNGSLITDPELRSRFKTLVIPPAWSEVWICPLPNGHIQVTGRDERGRKQYIYHPTWNEMRKQTKFERMLPFSKALPAIREQVDRDLRQRGFSQDKVLAIAVRLLEQTLIRIGNPEYARQNKSYGLVTLKDRHFAFNGANMEFHFRGKSGKDVNVSVRDRRMANLMRKLQDLPGQRLFQYVDLFGNRRAIGSGDVNDYLRRVAGDDFTAKDFRTWGGTVLAGLELHTAGPGKSERESRKRVVSAVKQVAEVLNNTPSVCRNYYIHPRVITAYEDGLLFEAMKTAATEVCESPYGLNVPETAIVHVLQTAESEAAAA